VVRIAQAVIATPWGDAAATLEAIRAGARPRRDADRPLFERLEELARRALAGQRPDLVLLATTKGDCPQWVADLLNDRPEGHGGPAALARELGAAFACPALALDAACAGGLAALAEGARRISAGRARRVLVLAGDRRAPFIDEGFAALRAVASERCRPFAATRDGLQLGDAAAAMVLDPGTDGVQVRGWAAANDAHHLTGPHRGGRGLATAARAALAMAGTQAPDWICAHATATVANDASEAAAYAGCGWHEVPVTGWKGTLGHSLGGNALVECALVHHLLTHGGSLPGIAGLDAVDPTLPALALLPPGTHDLPGALALKTAAGFGGFNQAVVLGPPGRNPTPTPVAVRCHARDRLEPVDGALPRPRARAVLGAPDPGWGRLDATARCAVALLRRQEGLAAQSAVLLHTRRGSAAIDRRYERARRAHGADALRFPYTLASAPLAEAMIRCGIRGPGCAVHGDAAQLPTMIAGLREEGAPEVVVLRLDSEPAAVAELERWR